MGAAVFLQSSTAVAVLVSNFVAKGGLAAAVGLAILLGADVGSALVTQQTMNYQPVDTQQSSSHTQSMYSKR